MFVFVFSAHNWLLNKEIQLYFSDLACWARYRDGSQAAARSKQTVGPPSSITNSPNLSVSGLASARDCQI